jgi:hypothetical protein
MLPHKRLQRATLLGGLIAIIAGNLIILSKIIILLYRH